MNQLNTTGIILTRIDYGEADRIITLLTPDHGKIRLMAKGVRRIKSKLAGGIELFSVTDVTFIKGRGEIGTLVSSRLITYYRNIVKDIDRTMLGYELIKQLNKATEDNPEAEYFELLEKSLQALDDATIDLELIRVWFLAQLMRLDGHSPNLHTDTSGEKLVTDEKYGFDSDAMAFTLRPEGKFTANEIKFLRLLFSGSTPALLHKVEASTELTTAVKPMIMQLAQLNVRS